MRNYDNSYDKFGVQSNYLVEILYEIKRLKQDSVEVAVRLRIYLCVCVCACARARVCRYNKCFKK
jgi:hypothetical protein